MIFRPFILTMALSLALPFSAQAQTPRSPAWNYVADLQQIPVTFNNGADRLSGTLILPKGQGPFPVVVYAAGSGRSRRDGYRSLPPIWKEFADRGIASFAWVAWNDAGLPERGQWARIAKEIGVSHEALYRELAKRRPAF
ncbi:MAG TPA: hypothetical protein VNI79_04125 [Sphingomicrobium sp.]|nr:hypothetical protein [Sphingomicrobium sp.]